VISSIGCFRSIYDKCPTNNPGISQFTITNTITNTNFIIYYYIIQYDSIYDHIIDYEEIISDSVDCFSGNGIEDEHPT